MWKSMETAQSHVTMVMWGVAKGRRGFMLGCRLRGLSTARPARPTTWYPDHVAGAPYLNLDQPLIRHPSHDRVDAPDSGHLSKVINPHPITIWNGRENLGLVLVEVGHASRPTSRECRAERDIPEAHAARPVGDLHPSLYIIRPAQGTLLLLDQSRDIFLADGKHFSA
jgi:hypothetical protein